jgi:ppGpp synthetase/RelA/SpoT-type nucleotidyltranferase
MYSTRQKLNSITKKFRGTSINGRTIIVYSQQETLKDVTGVNIMAYFAHKKSSQINQFSCVKKEVKKIYPCNRPWRLTGL